MKEARKKEREAKKETGKKERKKGNQRRKQERKKEGVSRRKFGCHNDIKDENRGQYGEN